MNDLERSKVVQAVINETVFARFLRGSQTTGAAGAPHLGSPLKMCFSNNIGVQ